MNARSFTYTHIKGFLLHITTISLITQSFLFLWSGFQRIGGRMSVKVTPHPSSPLSLRLLIFISLIAQQRPL